MSDKPKQADGFYVALAILDTQVSLIKQYESLATAVLDGQVLTDEDRDQIRASLQENARGRDTLLQMRPDLQRAYLAADKG